MESPSRVTKKPGVIDRRYSGKGTIVFVAVGVWLITAALNLNAQVIDRMMAVVNNHIITLSDVTRERLIREVLGNKGMRDDKAILYDLIDAQIIEDEIAQ